MIKDFLDSFSYTIKDKTKNPFWVTYIIVWLIRNWELIYSIFFFDVSYKLVDKVNFIKNYFAKNEFLLNIFINVFWTFLAIIISYVLINASRLIINFSEKRIKPLVFKITDSQSIVLKDEFENLKRERDGIQKKLDNERDSKARIEELLINLQAEINDLNEKNYLNFETQKDKILKIFKEGNGLSSYYRGYCIDIKKGNNPQFDGEIDYFILLGLITYNPINSKYEISNLGNVIFEEIKYSD